MVFLFCKHGFIRVAFHLTCSVSLKKFFNFLRKIVIFWNNSTKCWNNAFDALSHLSWLVPRKLARRWSDIRAGKNTGDVATSVLLMWVKIPLALVPLRSMQQLLFNSKRGLKSAFTESVWCEFKKNYSPTSPTLQKNNGLSHDQHSVRQQGGSDVC